MLIFPTIFQLVRSILLVLISSAAVLHGLRFWGVHRDILFLWIATMFVGLLGVSWGVFNGAPGAVRVSTVYLVWPLLYMLFIGLAHDLQVIRRLEFSLILGIGLSTSMALFLLFSGLVGFGDTAKSLLDFLGAEIGIYGGYSEFSLYNLPTVMYGFPFLLAYVVVYRGDLKGFKKISIYLLLFAVILTGLGSGRRAFWLIMLLSPIFLLFFLQMSSLRLNLISLSGLMFKTFLVLVPLLIIFVILIEIDINTVIELFNSSFSDQDESSGLRYVQATSLWDAFLESPLIGQGLGSVVGVVRSDEQPWAYELYFLALLMNVGLVGFFIYSFAVAWVIKKGVSISLQDKDFAKLFVPLITSLPVFIVLSSTNPYLGKFDYLWVIVLPVSLINAYLTRSK